MRVLALALALAAITHGPLVPLPIFGWLRAMLRMTMEEPITDEDTEVIIPVELDPDPGAPGRPPGEPDEPTAPSPMQAVEEAEPVPGRVVVDAGVPPPSPDGGAVDGGLVDAGEPEPDGGPRDAGADDAGAPVASVDAGAGQQPAGKIRDPYAVAGDPGAVTPEHPNVRVYIAADAIRKHPVGPMFSELLTQIPEWSEVISGTGVDPMRDFDHVLLSGPQFRDPSLVVAVMDYNIPSSRMKQALERAMAASKPPGRWLDGQPAGVEVASLGDDGYRRAVLLGPKRLFVLLPAAAEAQIDRLKNIKPFRATGEQCLVLYLITPWRAFRGSGFKLPERIRWMRLGLTPVDTAAGPGAGGYVIDIEAEDESPQAAAEDMKAIAEAIEEVRVLDLLVKKIEIVGRPDFELDGATIRARASVSIGQVERIIKHMKGWMKERVRVEKKKPTKPSGSARAPSSRSAASAIRRVARPRPRAAPAPAPSSSP